MKKRQPDYDLPILLVDDDAQVRDVLADYLNSFGFHNLMEVSDGAKALKLIQDPQVNIGLILSDWEMPNINGLILLRAVRNHPKRSRTPFMMITSQKSMERFKITQAAQWRVNSYLVKPFRSDILREKMWEVMRWVDDEDDKKKTG